MKLKFLGATGTVTGSKYLIEHNGKKILIDCGLFQGLKKLRLRNWEDPPINVNSLDAIVLTHAHIDHSGYIPRLVKMGFKGKIYCTPATRDLCKILLPDCGYLMEEEARYANKRKFSKHSPALPLFTFDDAQDSLKHFRAVRYNEDFSLGNDFFIRFFNAGHILGSSSVVIGSESKKICFSGDIGRSFDPILNPPEVPENIDYLVMESTYGNRLHETSDPMEDLEKVINRVHKRGGTIIMPAFAVGRTQEVLYFISKLKGQGKIPEMPVYLNSPMATNVTNIYCDNRDSHKLTPGECRDMCSVATYINSPEESKRLNLRNDPKLIVSASGMATGGRVVHHIKAFGPDEKNLLLFTGFQAAGTRGEKIVNGAESIRIHGLDVPIRAEVLNLNNLSAHADANELVSWAKNFKSTPEKVFITHGEQSASTELKSSLEKNLEWQCEIPTYLDEVDL